MSLVLETERLIMRAFQDKDILDFAEYRSDPDVAQYQGWDAPYSVEKAAEFIAENKVICPGTPGEWHQIALELKDGGNLIGDCVFHILPRMHNRLKLVLPYPVSIKGMDTQLKP